MEKGDVAWAGGSAGPDFFIMMGRSPGFGGTHTVWGSLADEVSAAPTDRDIPTRLTARASPYQTPCPLSCVYFPATQASMALALKLVRGVSSSKPGTMRILDEPVRFTIEDVSAASA